MNNIFRSKKGTTAKTIFVEGEPGSGKTSLCKKIVYDWYVTNHEERTESARHEISSQFDFVFYITLREAKNECKIKNMILKNIIDRIGLPHESADILFGDILKSNTCLLLLDGLDEWQHPEGCHLDERIPHVDTSWEFCTILITTRPYKLAELKIGCSHIDNHIMLKGVTNPEKLVGKLIDRLNELLDTEEIPDQCIKDIKNKNMWHFSECPIVLAHIVWLWYKRKLSADMRISDLYKTLLKERWIESCAKKQSSTGSNFNDITSALSQIAFEKLFDIDENKTIVFEIDDERNTGFASKKTAMLESGILSCCNVPGDEKPQYYFLHKTVQEYLAALFLSEDISTCILHIKNIFKNHRSESGVSLSPILLFLCGLNTKASQEFSTLMNEIFTDFCDRNGYSKWELSILQDTIIQGQIELDRSDNSEGILCLQHIYLGFNYSKDNSNATVLEKYMRTYRSCIVSLHIWGNHHLALPLAMSSDSNVLDLKYCKCLKYLNVHNLSFKDVSGLNLSNLVECRIHFYSTQQAPSLTSTFCNSDSDCLKTMKKLQLSNLTDLYWLHEGLERKGFLSFFISKVLRCRHTDSGKKEILDLVRLKNLDNLIDLGLQGLFFSDVVNLQELKIHTLRVGFIDKQQAPQLMSMLLAHGTCQNEREILFSHLKHVDLDNIHMSEKRFRLVLQSFIKKGSTTLKLHSCTIDSEENKLQLRNEFEQVAPSDCITNIELDDLKIEVDVMFRLVDFVTSRGQSVKTVLMGVNLEPQTAVDQPIFPMIVTQTISADYTTELILHAIKMSTDQICQLVCRTNQLNHSVTLRLRWCTEILDSAIYKCNTLRNQLMHTQNASLNCTKHIEINAMSISENLFRYAVTCVIYFGYMCDVLNFEINPTEVSNVEIPQPPTHTGKLRFDIVSMPPDVFERLACQTAVSGYLVECVLNKCHVWSYQDGLQFKEKMKENPAFQIEKFKFEPNNDLRQWSWPSYNAEETWNIRFKANANRSSRESNADNPEVTFCTQL